MLDVDADRRLADVRSTAPSARSAAAVLEFLRDQPFGDGAALRAWIASTNPFAEPDGVVGVELLTFHGAKGREWHTVVVTGVETGLVPHRSATTADARAEEARLLHVAVTRATDHLVLTWAARRGGYAARPARSSPGSTPPRRRRRRRRPNWLRRAAGRPRSARPVAGVARAGRPRRARSCPTRAVSDADLAAIAAARPATADELDRGARRSARSTAARLFPGIRAALDG